jgi:hypothetical protein
VSARLALTAEAEDLVETFAAELAAAEMTAWPSTLGGARSVVHARWCTGLLCPILHSCNVFYSAGPVEEQVRLSAHQRQFACWLMVTARMSVSAQFLARADLRLGAVAARYYPALRADFVDTARTSAPTTRGCSPSGPRWHNWPRCTASVPRR